MFTLIVYTFGCGAIAAILTVLSQLFKPIHRKGDSKPWSLAFIFFVLCFIAPYGYVEVLTKMYGPKMKDAIQEAYESSPIDGPLQYFRVIGVKPDKEATAYVIGKETEGWGGTDRPVVCVHLVSSNGAWKADSYKVLSCERLNKDGYTFPPYW